MNASRYQRLCELFAAALEQPPEQRESYVVAAAIDDPPLAQEVVDLLRHEAAAAEYFGELGTRLQDSRRAEIDRHAAIGHQVGAYRIEQHLGSGGMGSVYLARRADGQFDRSVAIKWLPIGLDDAAARQRFERERRILASLRHAHIAQLLDAGVDTDGRPYLVMEYIAGVGLCQHAQSAALGTRDRVSLFVPVCDAVQYAHRNLVVHRDLKPDNILVTPEGQPKLLDFGIAGLVAADGNPHAPTSPAFTPAYAAPEQLRGEPVSTSADIYALGVILFELLTGTRPGPAQADAAPPLPSRRDGVAARDLRGDLDSIVTRALQADPLQRYASAGALADDLRRYLAHEPVHARDATRRYRFARFLQRHRWGSAAALVAVLGIVGFSAFALQQAQRIARERDRAERVADLLVEVFAAADPAQARGRQLSAREVLDRSVPRVVDTLANQPETQASLLVLLGRTYQNLGEYERSAELLDRAVRQHEAAYGEDDARYATALVHRAENLRLQGQLDRADADLQRALRVFAQHGGDTSSDYLWALAKHGRLLGLRGERAAARRDLERALSGTRALPGVAASVLAQRLNDLASIEFADGRFAVVESLLREAIGLHQRSDDPAASSGSPELATATNNLGLALMQQGRHEEARRQFDAALALRRRLLDAGHPDLAQTLSNLGLLLQGDGDISAAEPLLREALQIRRAAFAPGHAQIAQAENNLALLLQDSDRPGEAEALFRQSLAGLEQALGPRHALIAIAQNNLGVLLLDTDRAEEAHTYLTHSLQLRRELLPPQHPHLAYSLLGLGRSTLARGDIASAATLIEEGHALRAKQLPATDPLRAEADYVLGLLRLRQQQPEQARALLQAAASTLASAGPGQERLRRRVAAVQATLAASTPAAD